MGAFSLIVVINLLNRLWKMSQKKLTTGAMRAMGKTELKTELDTLKAAAATQDQSGNWWSPEQAGQDQDCPEVDCPDLDCDDRQAEACCGPAVCEQEAGAS